MLTEVYVIERIDVIDYNLETSIKLFKEEKEARNCFEQMKQEQLNYWDVESDPEKYKILSSDNYFEIYEDGMACENNTVIMLSKQNIH